MPLKEKLVEHIAAKGAISVADYMELCAENYYSTRDPFGKDGDFTTAPEISQIFGEIIGAWIQDRWQHTCGSQAILCEAGPGRGTLMKDILRATRNSGLHESIDVMLVEMSPHLREVQTRMLAYAHSRIKWLDSFDALPKLPLFLVANEFFDALPIQQFVETASGARERGGTLATPPFTERKINYENGKFFFTPEGKVMRETSTLSIEVMTKIARHIKTYGGAALIIDYGYIRETHGDTLQAIRKHQYFDPLTEPGDADITAHVDFLALKKVAETQGVHVWEILKQGTFFSRLGAELRAQKLCKNASPEQQQKILSGLERIVSPLQMGELFKVMAITADDDVPAGFTASQTLDYHG